MKINSALAWLYQTKDSNTYEASVQRVIVFVSLICFGIHGIMVIAFFLMNIAPMAWHSVIAMLSWIWCLIWARKGILWLAILPADIELGAYAAQATYYFGYEVWAPLLFFPIEAAIAMMPMKKLAKAGLIAIFLIEMVATFQFISGSARPVTSWEILFIRTSILAATAGTLYAIVEFLSRFVREAELATAAANQHSQNLLGNILPKHVIQELSTTGAVEPSKHEECTVLFTDFSGFTQATATMPAKRVVSELNEIFAAFDQICQKEGVEKIKTIGDAYMAAAGLFAGETDHAQRCMKAALKMQAFVAKRNEDATFKWGLRVGIHTGPVVSGVVGKHKFTYDIWGDAVNIASRMESSGAVGRVNVSAYTYDLIRKNFDCEYRGKVEAKGKGEVDMYFVKSILSPSGNES